MTLVELLAVVAIIGALAALLLPAVRAAGESGSTRAISAPPGIDWNAIGSDWKINVGPAAGSSPALNTMGKIIRPARMAT
ncbi:MAG TPA: hypothetical protein PKC18_13715, partial [Lacipirellulaceae bacterium]|nr:hypothetical protein [Lacipirellulaceae bacterium]